MAFDHEAPVLPPWQRYRPRGIGDLLDRSLVLLRRRFVHIFALSLVLQLIEYLTGAWTGQGVTLSAQLVDLTRNFTDLSDSSAWLNLVLIAVAVLTGQLTVAVAALFVAADVDGRDADSATVAQQLFAHLSALLWTELLLGALLGTVLLGGGLAVAGIVALAENLGPQVGTALVSMVFAAGLVLGTALLLRLALTPVVVVIEHSRGWAAVARSWRLVSRVTGPGWLFNSRVRIALIYTVIMCTSWGVAALSSVPALGLQFAGVLGAEGSVPGGLLGGMLRVLLELVEVAGQAAIGPFGALAMAYFYFDLRARHEGLDLLLSARFIASRRQPESR